MNILTWLRGALANWPRPRQSVRTHVRNQAFGRGWQRHRRRRIGSYRRRRFRRGRFNGAKSR